MKADFPLFWIPLLPLLGAAINLLVGRKLERRAVHVIACGSVFGALVVAMVAVFRELYPLYLEARAAGDAGVLPSLVNEVFDWIVTGDVAIKAGLVCDPLTAVMILVVTFVGFLIHVYSAGYMEHEAGYARYFGYLNLFTGSMLLLVLGDNLALLFVGWEGVGVCSYLLIGFWYDKDGTERFGTANAEAGKKAFIVNRIGDLAFLIGMFVLFAATGTLNIQELAGKASALLQEVRPVGLVTVSVAGLAGFLLFIGATGKSAQIPLYIWLPDAMAGPTPVSALIHAATMVTAGVYMVARLNFIYMLSPTVMGVVALVGGLTALFAATIGIAQNDIKKVLAYSTVSQLGYMFLGVGVGAFSSGVFHLFTHAFFKACLFLGAGAVIHALAGQQDIRRMGALRNKIPLVHWTFLVSTLAISGIPVFAGFFSKDEILWKVLSTGNPAWPSWFPYLLFVLGMGGALCTAFYMFRLYYLTFGGTNRVDPHVEAHLHVPGVAMSMPLVVLAIGATVLGVLGLPELGPLHNYFHTWLSPVVAQGERMIAAGLSVPGGMGPVAPGHLAHSHSAEVGLMVASVVVALGGILIARRSYRDAMPATEDKPLEQRGGLFRLLSNKYWIDELYGFVVVKPVKLAATLFYRVVDRFFIDIIGVNGSAWVVDAVGRVARRAHNGNLQHYVAMLLVGTGLVVYWVSSPPDRFEVRPPSPVVVGQSVTFDATQGVIPDQRKLEYRWDFDGDGTWDTSFSAAATTSHAFPKAGKYKVKLEVRDLRFGTQAKETRTLRVEESPRGAPGEAR
ncbi:MAG: NADH-quinone oxidoreductase subunit L [Deltaproteobacteria bacterium]|nr:NADH-quinone oxidoreductase subunit L [Deltaproteobacteria bacterium]